MIYKGSINWGTSGSFFSGLGTLTVTNYDFNAGGELKELKDVNGETQGLVGYNEFSEITFTGYVFASGSSGTQSISLPSYLATVTVTDTNNGWLTGSFFTIDRKVSAVIDNTKMQTIHLKKWSTLSAS